MHIFVNRDRDTHEAITNDSDDDNKGVVVFVVDNDDDEEEEDGHQNTLISTPNKASCAML